MQRSPIPNAAQAVRDAFVEVTRPATPADIQHECLVWQLAIAAYRCPTTNPVNHLPGARQKKDR
jgi:hypothetical protein